MTGGGRQGKKAKTDDSGFPARRERVSKLVLRRAGVRPIYHELISGSVLVISTISVPRLGNKSSAMLQTPWFLIGTGRWLGVSLLILCNLLSCIFGSKKERLISLGRGQAILGQLLVFMAPKVI